MKQGMDCFRRGRLPLAEGVVRGIYQADHLTGPTRGLQTDGVKVTFLEEAETEMRSDVSLGLLTRGLAQVTPFAACLSSLILGTFNLLSVTRVAFSPSVSWGFSLVYWGTRNPESVCVLQSCLRMFLWLGLVCLAEKGHPSPLGSLSRPIPPLGQGHVLLGLCGLGGGQDTLCHLVNLGCLLPEDIQAGLLPLPEHHPAQARNPVSPNLSWGLTSVFHR